MEDPGQFPAYHFMRQKEKDESVEDRSSEEQGSSSRGREKGQPQPLEREQGASLGEGSSPKPGSNSSNNTSSNHNSDGVVDGVSGAANVTQISFDAGIPHGVGNYIGEVDKDGLPDGQVGWVWRRQRADRKA